MLWRFLKAAPKYLLVLGVIVGSTVAYFVWWFMHHWKMQPANLETANQAEAKEQNEAKVERVEAAPLRLLLVDNDLYDFDTGRLVFREWLNGTVPARMFWEKDTKTVLAQYEKAFVRYSSAGKELGVLQHTSPFAMSTDYQWALYSKDKDVWRADIDWEQLKFTNEKRITSIQSFNDNYFAQSIILGTDKTLVVRVANQLLRVNLATGDVHPMKMPLGDIGKRRSEDSRYVVGFQTGQFYCYDVDADTASTVNVGRTAMIDFQWLDADRCLAIQASKAVILYDRRKNTLTDIASLPFPCTRVSEASPDKNFVFCDGRLGGVLVDVKSKTATQVVGGSGVCWVGPNVFAFSREVPDSDLRGTWFQNAGEKEWRVSTDPFVVTRTGPLLVQVPVAKSIVFATKEGISKMNQDGTNVVQLLKLQHPPVRMVVPEDRNW